MTKVSTRNKNVPLTRANLIDWIAEAHQSGNDVDHITLDHEDTDSVFRFECAQPRIPCADASQLFGHSCDFDAPESALWKR